jgi:radical SAM superfamily enzyme YgiQ (UPF0313 family)
MASKVLLISANQCTTPEPVFPLGLAHLSAALRHAGHDCVWLDLLSMGGEEAESILKCRPDFVGISVRNIDDVLIRKQETFFDGLACLVQTIRRNLDCPVVLGGSGFSIFPAALLERSGADYGIAGEGEETTVALLEALEQHADYSHIPGLVYRQGEKIIVNPSAPGASRLAAPEPDRPAALTAHYLRSGGLNVQTQRGCAHRCSYCTYPLIEGRNLRRRDPESIATEFEQLQRAGARYVFIVDSVFNSSAQHVSAVCEALVKRRLKLAWGCFLRPQGLTPELMHLMRCAALTHIEFGSDSFCDTVLAAYRKDFTFDDIVRSTELAGREQIDCCHFLILGGPGETRETLTHTFNNSQYLSNSVFMAVVGIRIYPGTSVFVQAVKDGLIGREADLLKPAYYVAPGLGPDEIFAQLTQFARSSPNWIVGEGDPAYQKLVARLRQRGIVGPLWSYFSMIQQIKPQELAGKRAAPAE